MMKIHQVQKKVKSQLQVIEFRTVSKSPPKYTIFVCEKKVVILMNLASSQNSYKGFGVYRVAPQLYKQHYYTLVIERKFSQEFLYLYHNLLSTRNGGYFLSRSSCKEFVDKVYEEYNKLKKAV